MCARVHGEITERLHVGKGSLRLQVPLMDRLGSEREIYDGVSFGEAVLDIATLEVDRVGDVLGQLLFVRSLILSRIGVVHAGFFFVASRRCLPHLRRVDVHGLVKRHDHIERLVIDVDRRYPVFRGGITLCQH